MHAIILLTAGGNNGGPSVFHSNVFIGAVIGGAATIVAALIARGGSGTVSEEKCPDIAGAVHERETAVAARGPTRRDLLDNSKAKLERLAYGLPRVRQRRLRARLFKLAASTDRQKTGKLGDEILGR